MSYTGFVKPIINSYPFLNCNNHPKILEIGIDKGQSTLPIIQNLSSRFENFLYYGIDVLLRSQTYESILQFHNISVSPPDENAGRDVILSEENSLNWLAKNQNPQHKFDIIFLDGDHNYHTVSNELKLLQGLIHPQSIIVCDDFNGRHAFKDSFYGEREEYKNVKKATRKIESEKQGVQTAVKDFVQENPNWMGFQWDDLEPCLLYRGDVWEEVNAPNQTPDGKRMKMRDIHFNFNLQKNPFIGLW